MLESDNICPPGMTLNRDARFIEKDDTNVTCGQMNDFCMADLKACEQTEASLPNFRAYFGDTKCCSSSSEDISTTTTPRMSSFPTLHIKEFIKPLQFSLINIVKLFVTKWV